MTVLAAHSLSHGELTALFLGIGLLLASARILGELAKYFRQPVVLGEILAGIFLGPTVLGWLFPRFAGWLFPADGPLALTLHALTTLGITLFLIVAGMEVDLSMVWRQGRSALIVAVTGMVIPFATGFGAGKLFPQWLGMENGAKPVIFALFVATAMSITALPVIAKILLDLQMFRSSVGMVIVAAAIVNDIAGWLIFAFLLGLMGHGGEKTPPIIFTLAMTVGFAFLMLTLGRYVINKVLPFMQAHLSWPGGIIGMALASAIVCAAFTEWIGVHAIFGAFVFGIALGDSRHLRERTRTTLAEFISFFFAPLFFASIGLRVNFATNFDLRLILLVTLLATVGKVFGCQLGARFSGFANRESWAIGLGMNARGAMEIILGLLALEAGVIGGRMFVALVIMALVTSVGSGIAIQLLLTNRRARRFMEFLTAQRFLQPIEAANREQAISRLVNAACEGTTLDPKSVESRVVRRERLMASGIERGLAIPHARIPGLQNALVAIGFAKEGINFEARDGQPARIICLLLTPLDQPKLQLDLLADLARTLGDESVGEKLKEVDGYTEFLALLRVDSPTATVVD